MRDPRPTTTLLLALLGACSDNSRESSASDSVATSITTAPLTTSGAGPGSDTSDAPTTTGTTTSPTTTSPSATSTTDIGDTTDTTAGLSDGTTAGMSAGTNPGMTSTTSTTDPSGGTTDGTTGADCGNLLDATVRDFSSEHPDFETYGGAVKGLVKPDLGPDKNPVHAAAGPTEVTSGPDAFNQWYNDVPGVNQTFPIQLELIEVMPGIFQYKNATFFPIENQGFGNQGNNHNFHFTTVPDTS